jgi:peptide/nickel transport system substrate-binding protein
MKKILLATCASAMLVGAGAGAETLRYATAGDIYGLDPHSMTDSFTNNYLMHIYEPLVRYNAELKIEPALATKWEVIDPTRIRFYLREGVKFHGGQDFGADDVIASLTRATHPNSPIRGNLPALKSVEKVDDLTVDLILTGPTPLLNNYLTNIAIMDKGWLTEHNAVDPVDQQKGEEGYGTSNANGTGPFIVESRRPDALTVMVNNPDWWDTPVHNLTRIEHSPISSAATRVAALLSGEIDLIVPSPLQDADRIEAAEGVHVLENPGLRTIMLGINMGPKLNDGTTEGNPLADVRVRRAVMMATDMDAIQAKIMRGKSRNTGALIAPEVPGFVDSLNQRPAFDPEAAKALLAEAGYADGFAFNLNCPNDAYVNDAAVCQAMAAMLSKVGIDARLVTEPRTLHFQKAQAGQTDMFMLGWATLPMLDGFSVLSAMLHTPSDKMGTWNPGGYQNARVDELTQAVDIEIDEEKRRAMMVEAFTLAHDDVAWIPLHQQPLSWAARDGVEVVQTPDDLVRLWYARVTK